jgi:hypothetical protein
MALVSRLLTATSSLILVARLGALLSGGKSRLRAQIQAKFHFSRPVAEKTPMRILVFFAISLAIGLGLPGAIFAQDSASQARTNKKAKTIKKSTAKKATKAAPAKKVAAHAAPKLPAQAAATEYQVITLAVYASPGDTYQTSITAVLLSDKFAAFRLDNANTLEDLSLFSRIFVSTPKWVQMYPVDVDMETNWVLLKSDDRLALTAKFTVAETAAQAAHTFRYESEAQWLHDLAPVRSHALERRGVSSVAMSGRALLEGKIRSYGDHIANVLQSSPNDLKLGSYFVAPRAEGLPCQSSSPVVTSEDLQASIYSASAVNCEAITQIYLAPNFNFGFRMQAGTLQMHSPELQVEATRVQLLQNIAAREVDSIHKMSSLVKYSTPTKCETSFLTDKNMDVYYCTRSLRGFQNLSDSIVVVGRLQGTNYLYNMIRTSGFSTDSTQDIIQANLKVLGMNRE